MKIKMVNSTMVYWETGCKDDDGNDIIYKGYKIGVVFENGLFKTYYHNEYDSDFYTHNCGLDIIMTFFNNLENKDVLYTRSDIKVHTEEEVNDFLEDNEYRFLIGKGYYRPQCIEREMIEEVLPNVRKVVTKEEVIKEVEEWR